MIGGLALVLVFELILVQLLVSKLVSPAELEAPAGIALWLASVSSETFSWMFEKALPAITWPVVALIALFAMPPRGWLPGLVSRFQSLKLGAFEVQLSEDGARQLSMSA